MGETFDDVFPYYLAWGMTAEAFWDGDCHLVKAYRRAHEISIEEKNQELWMQGMYIYEAVSVAIHKAFNKNSGALQYTDKPYDLGLRKKRQTKEQSNEEKTEKTVSFLHRLTNQFNTQFAEKKKKEAEAMLGNARAEETKIQEGKE